jgi:glucoside 3-dehydrogenase (cytochrome c) catalytic subunit
MSKDRIQIVKQQESYDAIVVGSGISGGWAAKELTEKGLKTLVLERGRHVEHSKDYITEHKAPWEFEFRKKSTQEEREQYNVIGRSVGVNNEHLHFFSKDTESPYVEEKPFTWVRGYQLGGKSLVWGRHCYRISDLDFEANAKEGIGEDWPIRYKDIAPWYDYVEKFAGISGEKLGLAHVPDGQFQKPMELNVVEKHVRERIRKNFPDRYLTIGRVAILTEAIGHRTPCHYCGPCMRGCSTGSYFCSLSSTLPAAAATNNLTIRPYSVVHSVVYDKNTGKASGVRVIDAQTKESITYNAKVIFLCASTLGSTQILMNSKSDAYPDGIGNASGVLGHYLMDHHFKVGAGGEVPGFKDKYHYGNRPTGFYVPRFRNLNDVSKMKGYQRGFGYEGSAGRSGWGRDTEGFGLDLKKSLREPGPWNIGMGGFGEMLPYRENHIRLHESKTDQYGIAQLVVNAQIRQNELNMRKDMAQSAAEMLEASGVKDISTWDKFRGDEYGAEMGLGIHEMGTARMGVNPKNSFLNGFNQSHEVSNLFVTDGACMASSPCQNPSITYMALTARAVNYAVDKLKKGEI